MGLVKRTYVDQETVITAENLNAIQDAIIENEEAIEDQGEAIEGKYAKPSGGIPASDMASGVQTSLGKADTAYQKQSGGIPSTDLASGVQTSLGKADTAYQKPSGGIPSTDMAAAVQTSLGKADTAYQKPSGGIQSTDLASEVQTSLGKADTALHASDIDNTLTVTGKAADAKKTGDEISGIKNTLTQLETKVSKHDISSQLTATPSGLVGTELRKNVTQAGQLVVLDYGFSCSSVSDISNTIFANIASGYRPYSTVEVPCVIVKNVTSGSSPFFSPPVEISTNGNIKFPNIGGFDTVGAVDSNTWIYIHAVYFTDNFIS